MSTLFNKHHPNPHQPSKRHVLTLHEKVQVLKFMESHPDVPIQEICAKFSSNPRTLKRICDRRETLLQLAPGDRRLLRTRITKGTCQPVEICLLKWIDSLNFNNLPLQNHTLQARAKYFLSLVKLYLPNVPSLAASNGWINRFKIRNSIDVKQINCARFNSFKEELEPARNKLQNLISTFDFNDVFVLGSTMLYHSFIPNPPNVNSNNNSSNSNSNNNTINNNVNDSELLPPIPPTDKLSLFLCSNATGTDKLLPSVLLPDNCNKEEFDSLLVELIQGSNGWVSQFTFTSWFNYFQSYIGIKRKVLLILEYQYKECYISSKFEELYPNIQVSFLPEFHSNLLNPFSLGLIKSFKSYYRTYLIKQVLSSTDIQLNHNFETFHIDLKEAMEFIQLAWENVTCNTIHEAWFKSNIVPPQYYLNSPIIYTDFDPIKQLFDNNPTLNQYIGNYDVLDRIYMDKPACFPTENELLFVEESLSFFKEAHPPSPPSGNLKQNKCKFKENELLKEELIMETIKHPVNNNNNNNNNNEFINYNNNSSSTNSNLLNDPLFNNLFNEFNPLDLTSNNNSSNNNNWNLSNMCNDISNMTSVTASLYTTAPFLPYNEFNGLFDYNYMMELPKIDTTIQPYPTTSTPAPSPFLEQNKEEENCNINGINNLPPSINEINNVDMLLSLLKSHLSQGFPVPDSVNEALDLVSNYVHQFDPNNKGN